MESQKLGEMGYLSEAITKIEGNGKAQKKAYELNFLSLNQEKMI